MTITGDIVHREILEIYDNRGVTRPKNEKKVTVENCRIAEWDVEVTASLGDTVVWDAAGSPTPITAFDYLNLLSTIALEVEFTVDNGGTPRAFGITLQANSPFALFADDSYDGTGAAIADVFTAATRKLINRIAIKELNGVAGDLHIVMAKKIA